MTGDSCIAAVLDAARRLKERGGTPILAIDGRCGSGKTWLASALAERLSCRVFHMDDFYLPLSARACDWQSVTGGNMDAARFEAEVLKPSSTGAQVVYRPYSCADGRYGGAVKVPPSELTIVEGSYSQLPQLKKYYALRVFLTCCPDVQRARLSAREGERFAAFEKLWIPMEERYIKECGVDRDCDLFIDTGNIF